MIKKIIVFMVLTVGLLSPALMAYDNYYSSQNGDWKSTSTWTLSGYPFDRTDVAYIRNGHEVDLSTQWQSSTSSTCYVRQTHVGRWATGGTSGNGILTIGDGGWLRTDLLYIGYDATSDAAADYTGTVIVEKGGTLEANCGYSTNDAIVIGKGSYMTGTLKIYGGFQTNTGMGTIGNLAIGRNGGRGVIEQIGGAMYVNGALYMGTTGTDGSGKYTIAGDAVVNVWSDLIIGSDGDYELHVLGSSADIRIRSTMSTSNGTGTARLVFQLDSGGISTINVKNAVTLYAGTTIDVSGTGLGDRTYTLIKSDTGITVTLGDITVTDPNYVLSLSGDGKELIVTPPTAAPLALELGPGESVNMPLTHEAWYRHGRHLRGYNPLYVTDAVQFDVNNVPYQRMENAVLTLDDTGNWIKLPFARYVYDTVGGSVGMNWGGKYTYSSSSNETRIVFDDDDDAYMIVRPAGQYHTLMHSTDHCRTWTGYEMVYATSAKITFRDTHNDLSNPPVVLVMVSGTLKLRVVTKNPNGTLSISADKTVTSKAIAGSTVTPGRTGMNLAVTIGDKTHIVFAGNVAESGYSGTPHYAVTYNHTSDTMGSETYIASTGVDPPDSHNWPAITVDSNDVLHVVLGAHGYVDGQYGEGCKYTYSTSANDTSSWATPYTGFPTHPGYTYLSLVSDADDNLHMMARLHNYGATPMRLAYMRKKRSQSWESPLTLVTSFVKYNSMYARWRQKLHIDRDGDLFVTYWNYKSINDLATAEQKASQQAAYDFKWPCEGGAIETHSGGVLMSDDGGDSWRFVLSDDFVDGAGITPSTPPSAGAGSTPALVGHWTFDDAEDTLKDVSGYGNHGSLAGGADRTTDVAVGSGAVAFDGNGDYINLFPCERDMPYRTDCQFNGDFLKGRATLAFWIKLNDETPNTISKTGLATVGTFVGASKYPSTDGKAYVNLFLSDDASVSITLASSPDRTSWHHFAVTVDANDTAAGYKVYQNGSLLGSYAMDGTYGGFLPPVRPKIGVSMFTDNSTDTTLYYMDGKVDDVRMYNGVLSGTEIANLVAMLTTPGDFDEDGDVDLDDLAFMVQNWLAVSPQSHPVTGKSADLNGDGDVDFTDFGTLAENWSG